MATTAPAAVLPAVVDEPSLKLKADVIESTASVSDKSDDQSSVTEISNRNASTNASTATLSLDIPADQVGQVLKTLSQIDSGICGIAEAIKAYVDRTATTTTAAEEPVAEPETTYEEPAAATDEQQPAAAEPEEATKILDLEYPESCIPETLDCDWESFTNYYTDAAARHAIQVLVAGKSLPFEIRAEEHRRQKRNGTAPLVQEQKKNAAHDPSDTSDTWIHRVRIVSQAVMTRLEKCHNSSSEWKKRPMVFFQPFRLFIRSQSEMKEELAKLEAQFSESAATDGESTVPKGESATDGTTLSPSSEETDTEAKAETETKADEPKEGDKSGEETPAKPTKADLEELRCYVKFVDERILPYTTKFDKRDFSTPTKVRFHEVWHLFKPGDLIHVPIETQTETDPRKLAHKSRSKQDLSKGPGTIQTLWRVSRVHLPNFSRIEEQGKGSDCCESCNSRWQSYVACYRLDYDGQEFGGISKKITFPSWEGECEVTELPCYPIRFIKDSANYLKLARTDGMTFVKHITQRYGSYSGWTMMNGPAGEPLDDAKGERIKSPGHVESDVLVDFKEAFNTYPAWKPEFDRPPQASVFVDMYEVSRTLMPRILRWRPNGYDELDEISMDNDGIDATEFNDWIAKDVFLGGSTTETTSSSGSGEAAAKEQSTEELSEELSVLLPRRLFAYAVWERKFVHIDVRFLRRLSADAGRDAFTKLQIADGNKRLISALVHSHFEKKRIERNMYDIDSQDLIRGKGKGVVILLHGVPGVGKTATAEAVAQRWRRPLFPITCGDLGFTAESVENSLNEIFRLAHLWDCVLLLDEADVFITQRSKNDLQRNALVSVFLRMLEYYNGILFLTTNRPGVLDEAVKSRVHLNLRYDALDRQQTIEIFKLNMERLEEIEKQRGTHSPDSPCLRIFTKEIVDFAGRHWDKHTADMGRWNGRQIRNAFLIAASLAHYDGEENPGAERQLRAMHFDHVDSATLLYDQYRASVFDASDSSMALNRGERSDEFVPAEMTPYSPDRGQYQNTMSSARGPNRRTSFAPQPAPYQGNAYAVPAPTGYAGQQPGGYSTQPAPGYQGAPPSNTYGQMPPPSQTQPPIVQQPYPGPSASPRPYTQQPYQQGPQDGGPPMDWQQQQQQQGYQGGPRMQ